MKRVALLTIGVTVLVVLAGCSGLPGQTQSSPATTGPETTANPATSTQGELPPGVSETSVTDARELANAHRTSLENHSYTYERSVALTAENGTQTGQATVTVRMGSSHDQFAFSRSGTGLDVGGEEMMAIRAYSNGTTTFINSSIVPGGYEIVPANGAPVSADGLDLDAFVFGVFDSMNETEVSGAIERDGEMLYEIEGTSDSDEIAYTGPTDVLRIEVSNVSMRASVNREGIVREIEYGYNFSTDERSGYRRNVVTVTALGETDVERPAWVADAIETHDTNATDSS